jgi:phosphonoacetaldehyde hydrolase
VVVKTNETRIRLVVLDWAGTAVDFGCCGPSAAFADAFAELGVPVSMTEARAPMGMAKKEHIRTMLAEPALAARWQKAKGRPHSEADVEALYQNVTPRQVAAAERLGAPVPGLVTCVDWLRKRGIKVAGTTGYFRAAADAAAKAAAKEGYIPDVSVCADEVPAGRPAPWMMYRVMEVTGVYPAACVLKIGDTPVDMGEGRSAGAWCVGTVDSSNEMGLTQVEFNALSEAEKQARRATARERLIAAGAHACVDNLEGLPDLITEFDRRLARGERP